MIRLMIIILLIPVNLYSEIHINEIMSSNSDTIFDEFGESSDWLELYNSSSSIINLEGYGLSDDIDDLYKWIFPPTIIQPNDYLLIFASGGDIGNNVIHWETIINWGDTWKYFLGNSQPPPNWKEVNFNDSNWPVGVSGFGYGDGDDATIIPSTMSLFIRKNFQIDSIDDISEILLHVDYDDAFVAYINGAEIARSNIGNPFDSPPPYNQGANTYREATIYSGGFPDIFNVDLESIFIQNGNNVLSIQVHNYNQNSSDMTIIPFLTLGLNSVPDNPLGSPEILNLDLSNLHANFQISSSGEELILTNSSGEIIDQVEPLIIPNDISYGRQPDGGDSWLFFQNSTPDQTNNNSSGFESFCAKPVFLSDAGFYPGPIEVSIELNQNDYPIYYTLDGSIPTINSEIYLDGINLNESTVIRAAVIHPNCVLNEISTSSFFINEDINLPIVSLSTHPDNFWDWETGIYVMGPNASMDYPYFGANFWEDWEKPIHIEFFELDGTIGFSQDAGVKIFGGWSRGQDQKSLAIFARSAYGSRTIDYQIFPDKDIDEFKSIVLRNSGNDWYSGENWSSNSMLRDGMATGLMQNTGVDMQEYRPAVVYINGDYWGIHNIREKVNEEFLASNHVGVDPDELDQLELDGQIIEGDNQDYLDMISFIQNNSLNSESNYNFIETQIDIDNFIDYNVAQIYYANTDWPGNNIKFWRPHSDDGKWKWILYDTDFGFGLVEWVGHNTLAFALESNGPGWPNPPWSTFLLRNLMQNNDFKIKFINHFCYYLNTRFKSINVSNHIDQVVNHITPEMPNHISRWGGSFNEWNNQHISIIENFGAQRDDYVFDHLANQFNLNDTSNLTVSSFPEDAGTIFTSGQPIPDSQWIAKYFNGIPIELEAIPNPGYIFSHWIGDNESTNPVISIILNDNVNISAIFIEDESNSMILINEFLAANETINTDETGAYEDWIELYYNIPDLISLDGYFLTDDLSEPNKWIFPDVEIEGEGHLLIWTDDDIEDGYLHTNFKLSADGEEIALFDPNLNLIDHIQFGEQSDDISFGRDLDGSSDWIFFENPTPGASNNENLCLAGDINCDNELNVLDVVLMVSFILDSSNLTEQQQSLGDLNLDQNLDVLDVVLIVSLILN